VAGAYWQLGARVRGVGEHVRCDACDERGKVMMRQKVRPLDYRLERKRLCPRCAARLGYVLPPPRPPLVVPGVAE
jgi:hypothetical protein